MLDIFKKAKPSDPLTQKGEAISYLSDNTIQYTNEKRQLIIAQRDSQLSFQEAFQELLKLLSQDNPSPTCYFDVFENYQTHGYLQNTQKLLLGQHLKELEHHVFMVHLPNVLEMLSSQKTLSYDTLLDTHKLLFRQLYPWAGKDRQELTPNRTVQKGHIMFAYPYNIQKVFDIAMEADTLGQTLGHLAYAHPFLECNGRALFVFFDEYAKRRGKEIRWHKMKQKEFLKALTLQIEDPTGDALDKVLAVK